MESAKIYGNKRYLSKVNLSRYVFSDGIEAHFAHNRLDINEKTFPGRYQGTKENPNTGRPRWQVYQDELDQIIGSNPIIFTEQSVESIIKENPVPAQNAATEAQVAADAQAAIQLGARGRTQQEVGAVGPGAGMPTDVNASTVDPRIASAMLQSNNGAAEAAKARLEAARNAATAGAAPSVSSK